MTELDIPVPRLSFGKDDPELRAKPELAKALAAFQAEMPKIVKGSKAEIRPRDSAAYSYEYAELGDVVEAVSPLLGRHGLAFLCKPTWLLVNGQAMFVLVYKLMHQSGEQEVGLWPLPPPDRAGAQQLGSAITYGRRYAFQAVTGVAPGPGEDDDGGQAQEAPRPEAAPAQWAMADPTQKRRITNAMAEMGVTEDQRMAWVTGIRGIDTGSLDELTREQADALLDDLRPAGRQARTDVIGMLKGIGVEDQGEVLARLADWTGRVITGTADLRRYELAMVMRKAGEVRHAMDQQNHRAEGMLPDVDPAD